MTVDGDSNVCTCPSDYELVTSKFMNVHKCIPKAHIDLISSKIPLSTAKEMAFSSFSKEETGSTVSITSAVLADMFLAASTGCYFYQNERDVLSCQALGNLCVLQHFLLGAPSCAVFDLIQRSGRSATVNGINGWSTTLPFLSYRSIASSVLQTPVPMKGTRSS
ncbi:hypothetical protein DVH05_025043 [Phytophthora capsici]|nr:hypothetical protein DVH05_025043 [Phytophthora capsici]